MEEAVCLLTSRELGLAEEERSVRDSEASVATDVRFIAACRLCGRGTC